MLDLTGRLTTNFNFINPPMGHDPLFTLYIVMDHDPMEG